MYVYQWVEVNGYLASNVMFNMGDVSIHCVFSDYAQAAVDAYMRAKHVLERHKSMDDDMPWLAQS